MSDEPSNILRYTVFRSLVEPDFWHTLTELKLNVDRLDETKHSIWGMYTVSDPPDLNCRFSLDCTAFNSQHNQPGTVLGAYGTILNTNTVEAFKSADKFALLHEAGNILLQIIKSGEALKNPALLTRFFLLTFADLKKYHFHYWFAFPAFNVPNCNVNVLSSPQLLSAVFSSNQVTSLTEIFFSISDWSQRVAFVVEASNDAVDYHPLSEAKEVLLGDGGKLNENAYLVVADPSNLPENPSWTPRNLLNMLAYQWPQLCGQPLRLLCLRLACPQLPEWTCGRSLVLRVRLPSLALDDPDVLASIQWVGWERNNKGKLAPRSVNMSEEMDPVRLSESSVDLNLKLMKWRLAPQLDLAAVQGARCLLLGAGTLGCAVARCLLGWGVRHITLVDSGRVSYSNPVRQCLFTHTDCVHGGRLKAEAAAEALQAVFPGVVASGVQMRIPMPGHTVFNVAETAAEVRRLEQLITDHDVVFLLMDSRESRWLPSLVAAAQGKLTICAALGFDTYLVMRHGQSDQAAPVSGDTASVYGDSLGCYFCNDVTAPGNSQADRTLDQQCTVTRPGLSFVAAGLAVELLVSVLQHPLRGRAPASSGSSEAGEGEGEGGGGLGSTPHSVRGFLAQFSHILPASPRFSHCIACSTQVIAEYTAHGFDFLLKVFNDPKHLEDVAGLSQLHQQTEEAEVLSWSDGEEFE